MAQRVFLVIVGAIMVVSGIAALINPNGIAESLGIAAVDIAGHSELRATYGGLTLGWGGLLLAGLRYPSMALAGFGFTTFGGGGLVLARFFTALSLGGEGFTGAVTTIILFEVAMVAVAYILLRQALKDEKEPEVIR